MGSWAHTHTRALGGGVESVPLLTDFRAARFAYAVLAHYITLHASPSHTYTHTHTLSLSLSLWVRTYAHTCIHTYLDAYVHTSSR
jgi:hypothetical protein